MPNPTQQTNILGEVNRIEANPGSRYNLKRADGVTALDGSVLPSSAGTWILTEIVNVKKARKLRVDIQYDANAATTTGSPLVRVWTCAQALGATTSAPLSTDDVWSGPLITDGTVTATAVAGTKAAGLVEAHGPLQGLQVHRELTLQVPAVVANSAKLRCHVVLNVETDSFIMFEVAEGGDVTNRGSLRLYVTGCA